MQIGVLGPLEVRDGSEALEVSGARLRALLIQLAVAAPRPIAPAVLVDALWGERPPADQVNALQSLVSRLRRALGDAELIQQVPGGYRLLVEPDQVDVNRFERLARQGHELLQAGAAGDAEATLADALALWRGEPFDGGEDASGPLIARLDELRLDALADLFEARLRLERSAESVAELEGLSAAYPLRERFAALHMRALAAAGRQSEALATYERMRAYLADELGIDPSADLQAAQLAVLRGEAAVGVPPETLATSMDQHASRMAAPRNNLKATLTSFVGREDELARIGKLFDEGRLVTLVGPGGAGKTRLAVESSALLAERVEDGIWLAELAPVTDPADVPQTVLRMLGVRDSALIDRAPMSAGDATSRLVTALVDSDAVLVLDNCEHLIAAAADLADELLTRCPRLRIVTTSREPLGIFGEALVVVPPLGQPASDATADDALAYPATRLFADRAAAVRPDFVIDASTVAPVVQIVRRLDGQPLAIELAAARLRSLPVEQIALRLSDRFRLLTGGSRTAMPRHRTLRAVVEWSWELLSDDERLLAERLAVFAGAITPSSALAVCAGDELDAVTIEDLLASLADKSLLQLATDAAEPRYRMLETLREFGLDKMAERGEVGRIRRAHADYFRDLARQADPHLRTSDQLRWMALLTVERGNTLAALRYFCDEGLGTEAFDVVLAMSWYWMITGSHAEAVTWLNYVLRAQAKSKPPLRLIGEALLAVNSAAGDVFESSAEVEAGLQRLSDLVDELARIPADTHPFVVLLKPVMAMLADRNELAEELIEQALVSPDPWIASAVRTFRAALAENRGDVATMRADATIALAEFRRLGERWGMGNGLQLLAQVEVMDGNLDAAEADYVEGIELMREMGAQQDEAMMSLRLSDVLIRKGDTEAARAAVLYAQERTTGAGMSIESIFTDIVLAEIARQAGAFEQARALHDLVHRRLEQLPALHPIQGHALAVILATSAKLDLDDGDADSARRTVARAYTTGVATKDMPIVAAVGVSLALLADRLGAPQTAAQMLGAAARLRGADDPTHPDIRQLTERLRVELGAAVFERAYAAARALDTAGAIARLDPAGLPD